MALKLEEYVSTHNAHTLNPSARRRVATWLIPGEIGWPADHQELPSQAHDQLFNADRRICGAHELGTDRWHSM
jgi:hypothetical protein